MKFRILIPACLLLVSIAPTAYASEITGTLSAGSGSSVTGTVIGIPTATPPAGTYASAQSVTLSDPGSFSIRYTTDGSTPSCAGGGLLYTAAIPVASSLTIQAVGCYLSGASSTVGSYPYVISGGSLTGTVATSSGGTLTGTVTTSSGGSLTGTVTTSSGGSLSGTVTSSPGGSLTGTVTAPASSGGGTSSGGGGGGGSNGPPAGSSGGGGEAIIPTGTTAPPGEVLGASTGPTVPGTPNTGAGGNAPENLLVLLASGLIALSGGLYLAMRRRVRIE